MPCELRGRSMIIIYAFALCAGLVFLVQTFLPALTRQSYGFPAYYTAARLIVEGRWTPRAVSDDPFSAEVRAQTNGVVTEFFSGHPPITSLLLVPLATLDISTARALWAICNVAFLLVAVWLTLKAVPRPMPRTVSLVALALVLLAAPVAENVRVGQSYQWQLLLFAFAFWSLMRDHPVAGGISLAAALIFKLSGIPIWLLLVARHHWRAILFAVAALIVLFLFSVIVQGLGSWIAYVETFSARLVPQPWAAHAAYQTTPSFFQHLFTGDPEWNPYPLSIQPQLALFLTMIASAGALGLTLWVSRTASLDVAFAAMMTLSVILFPQAEEYHYTLLVLPFIVMGARLINAPWSITLVVLFIAALLLVALPLPYKHPLLNDGWRALLAYPRLYGGWLLWGLSVWQLRASATSRMPVFTLPSREIAGA